MENSNRVFDEGTREMLTSGLAYKNMSSLQRSTEVFRAGCNTLPVACLMVRSVSCLGQQFVWLGWGFILKSKREALVSGLI